MDCHQGRELLAPNTPHAQFRYAEVNSSKEPSSSGHYIIELDPTFLYSLAKVSLLEVEENLLYAHLVLMIPSATVTNTVDLYRVAQVGIHLGGGTCLFHKMPNFLYKKEDKKNFLPMTLDGCRRHNNFYVCQSENFSNETSCIQENINDCPLSKQICPHNYKFVMSRIGILLRNNLKGRTFSADLDGVTSTVTLSEYGTAYLYWKGLSSVQIGNKRISAPGMEHIQLKESNLSPDIESLLHYMDSENVTNVFKNICDKYNKSLSELITPAFDNWVLRDKDQFSNHWIIMIITIICFAAIVCWLGYIHYHLYKIQNPENTEIEEGDRYSLISIVDTSQIRRSSV